MKLADSKSNWIIACKSCQFEREVSYKAMRLIITGKTKGNCKKCSSKNKKNSTTFKKGSTPWNKGKTHKPNRSYEKNKTQMEIINAFGGIIFNSSIKNKMSVAKLGLRGESCNNWKGGLTDENRKLRSKKETIAWRKEVLKKDNYKCTNCGSKKDLHAHHIKKWSEHPDLRHKVENGSTLCKTCHLRVHKRRK